MPITKTPAYKVGDKAYFTIEEAQIAAIADELADAGEPLESDEGLRQRIAGKILDRSDELIAIITCKPEEEKPVRKPRSDKGTKRAKEKSGAV